MSRIIQYSFAVLALIVAAGGGAALTLVFYNGPSAPAPAVHDVAWFMAHEPERTAAVAACQNDASLNLANCMNAQSAAEKAGADAWLAQAKKSVGW